MTWFPMLTNHLKLTRPLGKSSTASTLRENCLLTTYMIIKDHDSFIEICMKSKPAPNILIKLRVYIHTCIVY